MRHSAERAPLSDLYRCAALAQQLNAARLSLLGFLVCCVLVQSSHRSARPPLKRPASRHLAARSWRCCTAVHPARETRGIRYCTNLLRKTAARREGFRSITKLVTAIRFGVGFRNSPMSANVQMSSATMHCSPLLTPTTSITSGKRRARRHYSAHFVTPEAWCATQIR